MLKIILALMLFVSIAFVTDTTDTNETVSDFKVNGNVSVVTNYVLFGKTLSDEKQAINSMINVDYKGIYATVHANSLKLDNEDALQAWYKIGYGHKLYEKAYIKANYIRDAYYGTSNASDNDGNYGEVMFGSSHLNFVSFDFYNLYSIDNNKWVIHRGTVSGNINKDNSLALTAGLNVDTLNFYELNYNYKVSNNIGFFAKGIYSDYIDSDRHEEFLLAGVNFSF